MKDYKKMDLVYTIVSIVIQLIIITITCIVRENSIGIFFLSLLINMPLGFLARWICLKKGQIGGYLYVSILGIFGLIMAVIIAFVPVMAKNKEKIMSQRQEVIDTFFGDGAKSANRSSYTNVNASDELAKYKKLLDDGAITQEEYNEKKKQLLNL